MCLLQAIAWQPLLQMKQSILLMDNRLVANAARRAVLPIDSEVAHMC